MDFSEAQQLEAEHLFPLYKPLRHPMVLARGQGARLWDTKGKEYLDFISGGRAVTLLGHCHPKVTAAICAQAQTLIHTSNDFFTEPQLRLAQFLTDISCCDKVFFCNSGAETIEAAIKLARKYAQEKKGADAYEIITALDSFHGRTYAALTATAQPKFHKGFEPLVPGFRYVPFNDEKALKEAVTDKTCAVLLEPILGESGVHLAQPSYLKTARKLCDNHGAVLILDEVQTGLGRTGAMFAYEHYGLEPDIFTLAKGLGGGVPIGAMLAKNHVAESLRPSDHASTFGGSPLPAAAALATLTAIKEEGLVENARRLGEYLIQALNSLKARLSLITEVRGKGFMIGVDFAQPLAPQIKTACRDEGLLITTVGEKTLRLLPPLILSHEEAERGFGILSRVVTSLPA